MDLVYMMRVELVTWNNQTALYYWNRKYLTSVRSPIVTVEVYSRHSLTTSCD